MATERRLIDANKLVSSLRAFEGLGRMVAETLVRFVEKQPTVDAVEVVNGRWVDKWGGKYANPHYECSECKKSAPYKHEFDVLRSVLWLQDLSDYCPNCGAKMDGGNEDG